MSKKEQSKPVHSVVNYTPRIMCKKGSLSSCLQILGLMAVSLKMVLLGFRITMLSDFPSISCNSEMLFLADVVM